MSKAFPIYLNLARFRILKPKHSLRSVPGQRRLKNLINPYVRTHAKLNDRRFAKRRFDLAAIYPHFGSDLTEHFRSVRFCSAALYYRHCNVSAFYAFAFPFTRRSQ